MYRNKPARWSRLIHIVKIISISTVATVSSIKRLIDGGYTHKNISENLEKENPGVRGLSVASVRKFYKLNGVSEV